jgi:hypothetical protein
MLGMRPNSIEQNPPLNLRHLPVYFVVGHTSPHALRCFAVFCARIIASLAAFSALSLAPRCSQVSRTAATFLRFTFS